MLHPHLTLTLTLTLVVFRATALACYQATTSNDTQALQRAFEANTHFSALDDIASTHTMVHVHDHAQGTYRAAHRHDKVSEGWGGSPQCAGQCLQPPPHRS